MGFAAFLEKARVRGHLRRLPNGRKVFVRDYDRKGGRLDPAPRPDPAPNFRAEWLDPGKSFFIEWQKGDTYVRLFTNAGERPDPARLDRQGRPQTRQVYEPGRAILITQTPDDLFPKAYSRYLSSVPFGSAEDAGNGSLADWLAGATLTQAYETPNNVLPVDFVKARDGSTPCHLTARCKPEPKRGGEPHKYTRYEADIQSHRFVDRQTGQVWPTPDYAFVRMWGVAADGTRTLLDADNWHRENLDKIFPPGRVTTTGFAVDEHIRQTWMEWETAGPPNPEAVAATLAGIERDPQPGENDRETACLVRKDGTLMRVKRGEYGHVTFESWEGSMMRGMVLTHNHPHDGGFSAADVLLAMGRELAEIRAFGTDLEGVRRVHILRPKPRGTPGEKWPYTWPYANLELLAQKLQRQRDDAIVRMTAALDQVRKDTNGNEDAVRTKAKELNSQFSEEMTALLLTIVPGIEYTSEVIP